MLERNSVSGETRKTSMLQKLALNEGKWTVKLGFDSRKFSIRWKRAGWVSLTSENTIHGLSSHSIDKSKLTKQQQQMKKEMKTKNSKSIL